MLVLGLPVFLMQLMNYLLRVSTLLVEVFFVLVGDVTLSQLSRLMTACHYIHLIPVLPPVELTLYQPWYIAMFICLMRFKLWFVIDLM